MATIDYLRWPKYSPNRRHVRYILSILVRARTLALRSQMTFESKYIPCVILDTYKPSVLRLTACYGLLHLALNKTALCPASVPEKDWRSNKTRYASRKNILKIQSCLFLVMILCVTVRKPNGYRIRGIHYPMALRYSGDCFVICSPSQFLSWQTLSMVVTFFKFLR